MTPDALIIRFEQDMEHAERALREEGTVHPLFAVVDAQERTRPVAADFSSEEATDVSFAIVRLMCAAGGLSHRSLPSRCEAAPSGAPASGAA